jgi:putative aldouronate transport system permease protein
VVPQVRRTWTPLGETPILVHHTRGKREVSVIAGHCWGGRNCCDSSIPTIRGLNIGWLYIRSRYITLLDKRRMANPQYRRRGERVRTKPLARIKTSLFRRHEWQIYLFALPVIIYFLVFHYLPMYGIVIAFRRYSITRGILQSPWVGFLYFEKFFSSAMFWPLMRNTIVLSFYQLLVFFPFPIILALGMNYTRRRWLKKFAQTVTYAPHFISVVVLVGMMFLFGSPSTGVINAVVSRLGVDRINFMGSDAWFRHIFVFTQVWQHTGYQAIIFLASLTAVDICLYEAATIDGATKMQKIRYIDLPAILPTTVTLLLLQIGNLLPSVRRTDPGSSRLVTHPGHAVISYTAIACSVKVRDRLMKLSTR